MNTQRRRAVQDERFTSWFIDSLESPGLVFLAKWFAFVFGWALVAVCLAVLFKGSSVM